MKLRPLLFAAISVLLVAPAIAQTTPTFTYGKPDAPPVAAPPAVAAPAAAAATPPPPPPPPKVEWKAQVKGGFLMTSGNAQTTGTSVAGNVSRRAGSNRLTVDANAAYGRSNVLAPVVDTTMTPPAITALPRNDIETNNNWVTRGRYDRFFTANNSGYVSAQAAADKIAGKSFYGGGQIGYSRQVYKSAMHLLVAELGYDFSYERYVSVPMTTHDPVSIHSARVFVGETLKLSAETGITANFEGLFNLNKEGAALSYPTGQLGVDAFSDTRLNGKIGLTTTLIKRLSISFGFTVKYDQNPAPLPIPSGTPPGTIFSPTSFPTPPFAEKVDTQTEATLVYTFL